MIYHVFANRSNVGDWLSARGIQALLDAGPVRELLCDEPFVAETIDVLSAAGPEDAVVIGGGGLFMDYFEPFWRAFEPLSLRLSFFIWGVGYCDLKQEPSLAPRELLSAVAGRSRRCIVRDELSRDLLGLPGLPDPVPCPALNVLSEAAGGHGILHVDNYSTAGAETYEAMEEAARRFAGETGRPFRKTNNRIPPGSEEALARCLEAYACSDLVLSSALHGCVIALAMGKKVLAVSGDRKIDAFMDAMGLGAWVLEASPEAGIAGGLSRLVDQPPAAGAVGAARAANRGVGEWIRREAGSGRARD